MILNNKETEKVKKEFLNDGLIIRKIKDKKSKLDKIKFRNFD